MSHSTPSKPHVLSLAADSRAALRARLEELVAAQQGLDDARFVEWIRRVNESLGSRPGAHRLAFTAKQKPGGVADAQRATAFRVGRR